MTLRIDPAELAGEIADIARTTTDAETARSLLELAGRLLSEAGLPGGQGGGDLPPGPVHATQVELPEFA
jgi:hypothetical protein